jgi:hypothetical protein
MRRSIISRRRIYPIGLVLAFALTVVVSADQGPRSNLDAEQPFLTENAAAMSKMMADMDVKPTGNVDRDFVAMMVPHHQGAIDMAQAVLRHGKNEQLRRLAQEIIVTQQEEIAAMRLAVGQPPPLSVPSPTTPPSSQPAVPHAVMESTQHLEQKK